MDTEDWREYKKAKQERNRRRYLLNMSRIGASGLPYVDKGETVLFRIPGRPKIDLYPSSGKWKVGAEFRTGGALAVIKFLKEDHDEEV